MAYYRFTEPLKQTDYIEFVLAAVPWFDHFKALGIGISEFRVRGGKLCFNTTADIPQHLFDHLGNGVEPG